MYFCIAIAYLSIAIVYFGIVKAYFSIEIVYFGIVKAYFSIEIVYFSIVIAYFSIAIVYFSIWLLFSCIEDNGLSKFLRGLTWLPLASERAFLVVSQISDLIAEVSKYQKF